MTLNHILVAVFVIAFAGALILMLAPSSTINRILVDEIHRKAAAKL